MWQCTAATYQTRGLRVGDTDEDVGLADSWPAPHLSVPAELWQVQLVLRANRRLRSGLASTRGSFLPRLPLLQPLAHHLRFSGYLDFSGGGCEDGRRDGGIYGFDRRYILGD
jgi:hypothetical protein